MPSSAEIRLRPLPNRQTNVPAKPNTYEGRKQMETPCMAFEGRCIAALPLSTAGGSRHRRALIGERSGHERRKRNDHAQRHAVRCRRAKERHESAQRATNALYAARASQQKVLVPSNPNPDRRKYVVDYVRGGEVCAAPRCREVSRCDRAHEGAARTPSNHQPRNDPI